MRPNPSRLFLATLGLAALTAFGSTLSSNEAKAAGTGAQRSYVAGHFGLELDNTNAGSVDKVSGGDAVATVVSEKGVTSVFEKKHIAGFKYEDITFAAGWGMSKTFYEWIKASLAGANRKSGAIVGADYDENIRTKMTFTNALISEITFPALEASSKEAAWITVAISPEATRNVTASGKLVSQTPASAKRMMPSNFRVQIPGLEDAMPYVSKVEAISVRFKAAPDSPGESRTFQKPGPADVSNLVITVPESHSASLYKWHDSFIIGNKNTDADEKTVTIQMLDTSLKTVFYTLTLKGVGLISVGSAPSESAQDTLRKVRAEMYVESIAFDYTATAL